MDARALLAQPRLTVVSGEPDFDLRQLAQVITSSVIVEGRDGLTDLFARLLAEIAPTVRVTPKTLDLIGHTRSSASLMTLGAWMIDLEHPTTMAMFRELADHRVLPKLGVRALRLLGCATAGTARARATIEALGDVLGLEVFGTSELLSAGHYNAAGFRDCWSFLLVSASELRRGRSGEAIPPPGCARPRVLDLDALPAIMPGAPAGSCPRRVASAQAAHEILQLVRRREGARMPGLATPPSYELLLPSATPGAYHAAHVLLEGAFLQVYPDGIAAGGIAFPVEDAGALRQVIAALEPDPELSR